MAILAFDVGGSSIKYALMTEEGAVQEKGSVPTPDNLVDFYGALVGIKEKFAGRGIMGAAFSMPGAVDNAAGVIGGASAIPYIHNFPIKRELSERLSLPVSMENDANCAALGEVWLGAAKGCQDAAFFVIGSGVGGALIKDGKVHHGRHLHGGEFGFMVVDANGTILSQAASTRAVAEKVAVAKGFKIGDMNGKEAFALYELGDEAAVQAVGEMYAELARAIYNIQYSFDPEVIIIGGAISERADFVECIERQIEDILVKVEITHVKPKVVKAAFGNDANLIGAVRNFLQCVN